MLKRWLVISGLLFISAQNFAQQKFFDVRGKEIIAPGGKFFLMNGTNLGNWLVPEGYMFKFDKAVSPRLIQDVIAELIGPDKANAFWKKYLQNYIAHADIHYLKTIGVNSLRIPFHYKLFTDEEYMGGSGEQRGFALLDSAVKWCKQEGLYVILDMHCAPGGQTGDNIDDSWGYLFLYESEENIQQTISIWKKIAAHYANETAVMGYDVLNEPIPHFYDITKFNPLLEPVYKRIVAGIRQADKNHIVFLGGAQWDSNFDVFGPPFESKLVYTFHKYWTAPTKEVIQPYLDFSSKYNVPLYMGESGENSDEWITEFRKVLDSNKVGWHFWPYKKMDDKACFVQFNRPHDYSVIKEFADTSRSTLEEIRKARPDIRLITEALNMFLENCQYKNCFPNKGYIEALGLKHNY